jgi:hypothetical protein
MNRMNAASNLLAGAAQRREGRLFNVRFLVRQSALRRIEFGSCCTAQAKDRRPSKGRGGQETARYNLPRGWHHGYGESHGLRGVNRMFGFFKKRLPAGAGNPKDGWPQ